MVPAPVVLALAVLVAAIPTVVTLAVAVGSAAVNGAAPFLIGRTPEPRILLTEILLTNIGLTNVGPVGRWRVGRWTVSVRWVVTGLLVGVGLIGALAGPTRSERRWRPVRGCVMRLIGRGSLDGRGGLPTRIDRR